MKNNRETPTKTTGLPRQAFFKALAEIAKSDPSIVLLDADVARSTGSDVFRAMFPNRFVSVGVAEQNMMGVAAGMSLVGLKPYASTFAVFAAERPFEIIRNTIAYSQLNVKIVATHAGVGVGPDGASHQANEDIGILRVLPNMMIVAPSDAAMATQVAYESVRHQGPMYIRLGRSAVPDLPPTGDVPLGKAILRREGSDVGLIAYGTTVASAIEASQELAQTGIAVAVLEVPTIKPLDVDSILKLARSVKTLISVEEHSIIGGLGSAIAECLSNECIVPLFRLGIPDEFSESGTMDELLEKYGLTGRMIAVRIREIISKRTR
jgi:transketolase